MPVVTKLQKSTYKSYEYGGCCSYPAASSSDISYNAIIEMKLNRAKDRRPKPQILQTSPTTQTLAYESRQETAVIATSRLLGCTVGWPPNVCKSSYRMVTRTLVPPVLDIAPLPFDMDGYNRRLIDKINDAMLDLSGTIAEMDEVAGLFWSLLGIIDEVRYCMRHVTSKRCRKHFKSFLACAGLSITSKSGTAPKCIANNLLALNFGLKPLASTLYDIVQEINEGDGNRFVDFSFQMGATKEGRSPTYSWMKNTTWSIKGHLALRPSPSGLLSVGNPLEWVWERVPFSFVVDWMVPIGYQIASLEALQSLASVTGTISEKVTVVGNYDPNPWPSGYRVEKMGSFSYRSHQRKLAYVPGMPDLFQYKPSSSCASLLNALALIVQRRF